MLRNLSTKINLRMVLKVTGWLLVTEALFMLAPMATSLYFGEIADMQAFILAAVATMASGIGMRSIRTERTQMGRREGFLLTATVWVWFSLFGMLPFIFCTDSFTVSDAFFETMSGFTTTGASVLNSHSHLGHGINLWRTLMQWIGGMGIILFTLAVIPMLNSSGGMQMFNAEVTGITHDKVRPRISSTAKALWGLYFGLTIAVIGVLWAGPLPLYDSVCLGFSTISTGGFVVSQTGPAAYGSTYVTVTLIVFMFLGGTNFALLIRALTGRPGALFSNEVFRTYILIILASWLSINVATLCAGAVTDWTDVTTNTLFQVVSAATSTGFMIENFDRMGTFAIALVSLLMFMGACAGSTSGGAKIDRMLFLVKHTANEIVRCVRPNAVLPVRISGKVMPVALVDKVVAFMCLYVIVMFLGGLVLTIMGMPLVDAFFSAFSCVSNAGVSATMTGYGQGFDSVPDAGKWVLSLLMLVGRLELFTVLILFTRSFWRK